ncbi:hypothetical protein [Caproiciproducens sp.]
MGDTFIHLLPLPAKVYALTIPDECGNFTIIINSELDDLLQRRALEHELKHVALDHFYDENDVAQDEREVEGKAKNGNLIAI